MARRTPEDTAPRSRHLKPERVQKAPQAARRTVHLKEALRMLREQHGLSQGQLADALGITAAVVSGWESGRRQPSVDRLLQMAELYDLDLGDLGRALALAGGDPAPPPPNGADLPTPEKLAHLLLGGGPGELPVDRDERDLAELLQAVYDLASRLRRD